MGKYKIEGIPKHPDMTGFVGQAVVEHQEDIELARCKTGYSFACHSVMRGLGSAGCGHPKSSLPKRRTMESL